MRIHAAKRLLVVKVVYYGPGLSGKTTNLVHLHEQFQSNQRGALVKLDTETERTLFFDYFPAVLGNIGGFRVKVDFFTVPGQSFYSATRRLVLDGADGVVFVADSSASREEANLQSRDDMEQTLRRYGRDLSEVPHVYQWNKRDAADAIPVRMLEKMINPEKAPSIEAVAIKGTGVRETQSKVLKAVFEDIRARMGESSVRHA